MPQALIQHHHSFTDLYQEHENGIPPQDAALITRLIRSLALKCLKVYADDFGILYYGVIDSDGTMIEHSDDIAAIVAFLSQPSRIR